MENKVIKKTFKRLKVGEVNENFRNYNKDVVSVWVDSESNQEGGSGFELEYAIDEVDESGKKVKADIFNEFISVSLSCGIVNNLRIDEDNFLVCDVKFKLPEYCNGFTKKIYESKEYLDTLAIVPKGKGTVEEFIVQNDYELYGFNLILKEESSFKLE
jgi:hypothetical protein